MNKHRDTYKSFPPYSGKFEHTFAHSGPEPADIPWDSDARIDNDSYEELRSGDSEGARTFKTWNTVFHYKWKATFLEPEVRLATPEYAAHLYGYATTTASPFWGTHGQWQLGDFGRPVSGLPSLYDGDWNGVGTFPMPAGHDERLDNALKSILPAIRPSLSLLNSIYELKDFRTLPRTIARIDAAVIQLEKKLGSVNWGRTLRAMLGSGSDTYLQAQFNVQPLLKDIAGLWSALSTARHQANRLVSNADRWRVHHYVVPLGSLYPTVNEYSTEVKWKRGLVYNQDHYPALSGLSQEYRTVICPTALFHVQIEFKYNLSQWQRENAALLSLLDVLGVNPNPAVIWNAIPWTFVIDWVAGVSRWLDQFKSQFMEPVTIVRRCLYSYHVERIVNLSVDRCRYTPYATGQRSIVKSEEESYIRVPFTPNFVAALTGSGINPKEFVLSSALYFSRLRP